MILFFEQKLPHYRIPVLARLQEGLRRDLTVCAGQLPSSANYITKDEGEMPFPYMELRTLWLFGAKLYAQAWFSAFRRFGLPEVVIVRHAIRNLTLLPLLWSCRCKHIPVVVWGQGYSRHRDFEPGKNVYDKVHLSIVRLADAYVCYTPEVRETLAQYIDETRLFVAMNTLDTQSLFQVRDELRAEGKGSVKRRLGLQRKYYLIFVGRLQPRKQIPYLLEVYEIVNRQYPEVGLIIIGNGDQEPYLRQRAGNAHLQDVHMLGFKPLEETGEYLFASDALVIPGWLGLAVNHAFVFGLPVVSQRFGDDLEGHAPEAAYVEHGVTGWFAQEGDKAGMAEGIVEILKHQREYSMRVSEYVEKYLRIERMIEGFAEAIAHAKARRPSGARGCSVLDKSKTDV